MVEALRYKLSSFNVNMEGPEEVYWDNKSVVKNYSILASVLNQKIRRYILS